MTNLLAQIITWINVPMNALGKFLLTPLAGLPGWLSNTIISAVTGLVLLIIFKYTSNQKAYGRVRDNIKADMLALKLFKDSISVTLKSEGRVFKGAFLLLFYAIKPMLVMIVPVALLLSQMGLWYQFRPLRATEETIITLRLNSAVKVPWPSAEITPTTAINIISGPVRILSKNEINWKIKALESGYHRIIFQVDEREIDKALAVGDGFMRVSAERPAWRWVDILQYPMEKPFGPDSIVKSISVDYPERLSKTSGTDWWLVYFIVASMVFALIFKPFLKVRI